MKLITIVLLVITFISQLSFADNKMDVKENSKTGKTEYLIYPFVFYSPETNLAFGVGGITYFKSGNKKFTKPSKITFSAVYSINKQYTLQMIPQIYLFNGKIFLSADIKYGKSIDKFYGIGNRTNDLGNEDYELMNLDLKTQVSYKVYDNLQYGIIYEFVKKRITDKKENELLKSGNISGTTGGISSGMGYAFLWDTRDNIFSPASGGLYELQFIHFSDATGSEYNFNTYEINFRRYGEFWGKQVLAMQFYMNLVRGFPPYYKLALLGGQNIMRGYYEGRYRDQNYFAFQAELRKKLFWRIGAVAFAGLGDVSGRVSDFKMKYVKASYGGGLRFMFDEEEKLNIRVDIGFGKGTSGIYFSIEEAF